MEQKKGLEALKDALRLGMYCRCCEYNSEYPDSQICSGGACSEPQDFLPARPEEVVAAITTMQPAELADFVIALAQREFSARETSASYAGDQKKLAAAWLRYAQLPRWKIFARKKARAELQYRLGEQFRWYFNHPELMKNVLRGY